MTDPTMTTTQVRKLLDYVHALDRDNPLRCLICGRNLKVTADSGALVCIGSPEIHDHDDLVHLVDMLPDHISPECVYRVLADSPHDSVMCLACHLRSEWVKTTTQIIGAFRANPSGWRTRPAARQMTVTNPYDGYTVTSPEMDEEGEDEDEEDV